MRSGGNQSYIIAVILASCLFARLATAQLPDDIQSELEASLREQAKIQAMRDQQQQRSAKGSSQQQQNNQASQVNPQNQKPFDPNNFSFQQVSPPVQYSYYQPYGDAAAIQPNQNQNQPAGAQNGQPKMDFNIDTLNFELPKPEARTAADSSPGVNSPQFTGVGGLPVGNAPLPPQAQQSKPLTEADFKDITGGENYGAPGGDDFGLGTAMAGGRGRPNSRSGSDSSSGMNELGDFNPFQGQNRQQNVPDFGAFGFDGSGRQNRGARRGQPGNEFAGFDGLGGGGGDSGSQSMGTNGNDGFDSFASQPQGDSASANPGGGAPGSLQSLLGSGFPGLAGEEGGSGWDPMASGNGRNGGQQSAGNNLDQVTGVNGGGGDDVGSMDIADIGDKSDQFSGANLGSFEQPGPQNDQDFNLGAAASENQPKSVAYPDENPQFVGTLWALTQPQSLSQTRYNAQIDKGTYQDYPSYTVGGNDRGWVSSVVDSTPAARSPGLGRYSTPSSRALAPEVRAGLRYGQHYDYSQAPSIRAAALSSLI